MKKHFPKLIDIPYMPLYIRMVDLHHPPYKQAIRQQGLERILEPFIAAPYTETRLPRTLSVSACVTTASGSAQSASFSLAASAPARSKNSVSPVPDTLPLPGFPVSSILLPVPVKNAVHMLWKPHIHRILAVHRTKLPKPD